MQTMETGVESGAGTTPGAGQPLPEALETSIARIMSRDLIAAQPEATAKELTELMLENGISHVPITDADGKLVGIVTKTDLAHGRAGIAANLMHDTVLALPENASVARAAELMAVHRIHAVPVVSADHHLVGLVTSLDVLGWVAGLG